MAVTSAAEFFALLEKSGLLIPAQLIQARHAAIADETPRMIARNLAHQNLITRWQAGQLLAGRSSFYLGKYRLIELLGRGGMGASFLAEHVTMNRRVVLKVISRAVSADQASLDAFLADARDVATLDHPNIVHAYSVDNESGRYFLVMEYVEGADLQQLVKRNGPLDYDRAADYVRQAADGLDHAHQRNMIHGKLNPSHLLVNAQGVLKILDLGLTRLATVRTMTSPDVARQADIHALGCTLYFLLTGQPPYAQLAPAEHLAEQQPTSEPPDIRQIRPSVPLSLAAICRKMMAQASPDDYPAAAAASLALAQWQASAPRLKRATPLPMAQPLDEP
jgi:serine/threonine-protein kinase